MTEISITNRLQSSIMTGISITNLQQKNNNINFYYLTQLHVELQQLLKSATVPAIGTNDQNLPEPTWQRPELVK